MSQSHVKERLKEIFENTIESGIKYDGSVDKPEYYSLFCKAAANDQLYQLMGNNLCMFNCQMNGKEVVMMLFSIPINSSEEAGAKNVAERVMEGFFRNDLPEFFGVLIHLLSHCIQNMGLRMIDPSTNKTASGFNVKIISCIPGFSSTFYNEGAEVGLVGSLVL